MKSSKDRWYNNVVYLFLAGTFCPLLFGYMIWKNLNSPLGSDPFDID